MGAMRTAITVALALLAASCGSRPAEQARPGYDVHRIAPRELLREANHGRDIEGPDGRYVLPPAVRRAWVDVGAHWLEQTRAELERNDDVAVIAIEPLEECWKAWPDNPRLIALPVAISLERGSMDFHVNTDNATSSLLPSVDGNSADRYTRTVRITKVPVLRLEDVLERIPPGVEVEFVKTDVQGLDLQVLKSAGEQLRRVERVQAEVINEKMYEGSGELRPGTETEFVSYMQSKGFRFVEDSAVHGDREWLDKIFVNPQRQSWLDRIRERIPPFVP
jgi:FkbM family methyltransferase